MNPVRGAVIYDEIRPKRSSESALGTRNSRYETHVSRGYCALNGRRSPLPRLPDLLDLTATACTRSASERICGSCCGLPGPNSPWDGSYAGQGCSPRAVLTRSRLPNDSQTRHFRKTCRVNRQVPSRSTASGFCETNSRISLQIRNFVPAGFRSPLRDGPI